MNLNPDGDNQQEIQQAIDACAGVCPCVVPAGTWPSGPLYLRPDLELTGQPGAALQALATGDMLSLEGGTAKGIRVHDITLDCVEVADCGLNLAGVERSEVRRVRVRSPLGAAVILDSHYCVYNTLDSVHHWSDKEPPYTPEHGFLIRDSSGNRLTGCTSAGAQVGFALEGSATVNHLWGCSAEPAEDAVHLGGQGNVLFGQRVEACARGFVYAEGCRRSLVMAPMFFDTAVQYANQPPMDLGNLVIDQRHGWLGVPELTTAPALNGCWAERLMAGELRAQPDTGWAHIKAWGNGAGGGKGVVSVGVANGLTCQLVAVPGGAVLQTYHNGQAKDAIRMVDGVVTIPGLKDG